jgi:bacillithiol biosynthesis deacetylase BshB1
MQVNVLCIGAHPDDVEVGIGGLVCKLTAAGHAVGILDLTRGEMASRGSVAERAAEATEAARILGVSRRENAGLPDGALANTTEQQRILVPILRSFRANVLILPHSNDRHPDHAAAHALVRDANYFAGLTKIEGGEPHRSPRLYAYRVYGDPEPPSMIVDVSTVFETKIEALRAYRSQLFNPEYEGEPTYVSSELFWESLHNRASYWGSRISVAYAETLYALEPIPVQFPPGLEGTP